MNSRVIIFLFLALISENVFSQDIEEKVKFEDGDTLTFSDQEYMQLYQSKQSTDKSLLEAKEEINLLRNHAKIKEDSLRNCLNPVSIIDSLIVLNTGTYYALIIAVEDYDNLPDLRNPINDAKRLKDVLVANYTFKSENIEILENPAKTRISNVLDWYAAEQNKDMVNSNLLIFYAGHGGYSKRLDDGYWCPSDGDPIKYSTMIRNSSIREYIQLIQARNILLISDACWAGSLMRSAENINKADKYQEIYNLPSRKYMSSGVMSEVPDKSTFLRHLVLKLENNKDKYLSANKLFSRISEDVLFETPITGGDNVIPQFSYIRGSGHKKGGDFFFIKK